MNNNEILNKYIYLVDKGYCCDCNELNCIDNFPQAKITHAIRKLQQENKHLDEVNCKLRKTNEQLKDNWNKLKEYLFDIRKRGFALQNLANVTKNTEPNIAILIIINKMQEIEQGSDSDGQ